MRRTGRGGRAAAILTLAATMALVGCGGEPEGADTGGAGTATTTGASAGAAPAANAREYCARVLRIETLEEPDIDFERLTPDQQKQEARKFAGEKIVPLAEDVQKVAPGEIRGDIDLLVGAVRQVAATGDFEAAFGRPDVDAASDRAHAFELRNCGWGRADVTAVDYAFEGVPAQLRPGPLSFELANRGTEKHELVVLRVNDDVRESVADIFKLPEDQARTKVRNLTGDEADPGQSGNAVVDLKPGRYALACFLPVGGRDGPPHITRGMFAEVKVA